MRYIGERKRAKTKKENAKEEEDEKWKNWRIIADWTNWRMEMKNEEEKKRGEEKVTERNREEGAANEERDTQDKASTKAQPTR